MQDSITGVIQHRSEITLRGNLRPRGGSGLDRRFLCARRDFRFCRPLCSNYPIKRRYFCASLSGTQFTTILYSIFSIEFDYLRIIVVNGRPRRSERRCGARFKQCEGICCERCDCGYVVIWQAGFVGWFGCGLFDRWPRSWPGSAAEEQRNGRRRGRGRRRPSRRRGPSSQN